MSAPVQRAGAPSVGRRVAARATGAMRPSDLLVAFFALAVVWLLAAAVAAAVHVAGDVDDARWVALHLAFVGGVSQLVLGAAQFFACAFLATDPPSRALIRGQLAVWNTGALAMAVGVPAGITALTGAGGALLIAGLALFAAALRGLRQRSLQRRPWATRWYEAAALALAAGAALGPFIAAGSAWPHGSLLAAHLVLNLGGWFGTAIVGTLHTLYPSLTATHLRHPQRERVTFGAWTAGIATLAVAAAFDVHPLAVAGWVLLLGAAALLASNLAASARSAQRHTAPATLIGAGQALLVVAVLAGLGVTIASGTTDALLGPDRLLVAALAVFGWIGLTVAGSMLHLLALMAHVRRLDRPAAPGSRDRPAFAGGAAVFAGALALAAARLLQLDAVATAAGVVVALGYLVLGARIVALALSAVRAGSRPRVLRPPVSKP